MAKPILGYPRHTAEAVFSSNNSFDSDYPVGNCGVFPFSKVARTSDKTGICVTAIFAEKKRIEVVTISRHNIIVSEATRRIKLYEDEAGEVLLHDSGVLDLWPATKTEAQVDFDGGQWWDRGYRAEEKANNPVHRPYFIEGLIYAKRVDVCLEAGAHVGDVDIGMIDISAALVLPISPSVGARYGFTTRSEMIEADGGVEYFERKNKPRVFEGELAAVATDDAKALLLDFQRETDITEPFLWWLNREDELHTIRDCYMARNVRLGLMAYVTHHYHSVPINIKEIL